MFPELLTVQEASDILKISRPFVYNLCSKGKLRTMRTEGRVLVHKASLLEFIEKHSNGEPIKKKKRGRPRKRPVSD